MFRLINGDCIEKMKSLISEGLEVDLILTDPPYGTVKGLDLNGWKNQTTEWDNVIPMQVMFDCCNDLLRVNGNLILFSQEPYTSQLRTFNHHNISFNYPYYWFKDHFANSLSCKKAPVSYIEDISVFRKKYDVNNNHPLREYSQRILDVLNISYKDVEKILGHRKAEHFFYRNGSSQFSLCTEETYRELIMKFNIDKLDFYKSYSELKKINQRYESKFNLAKGKKFKSNVLKYRKSYNNFHPTEKPVKLLENLIHTYTDKGDVVLDFTMGSGSTGVACKNTGRSFVGIELSDEYYDVACKRVKSDIG